MNLCLRSKSSLPFPKGHLRAQVSPGARCTGGVIVSIPLLVSKSHYQAAKGVGRRSQGAGQAGAGRVAFKVQPPFWPATTLGRPGANTLALPSAPRPDQLSYPSQRWPGRRPVPRFMGEVRAAPPRAGWEVRGS